MEQKKQDQGIGDQIKNELSSIPAIAQAVITNPVGFFRQMPKSGGFIPPLVFMVAMGVAGGLLQAILSLLGLGAGGVITGLAAVVLMPLLVGIFGFVGAAVLFAIWKIMGSDQSYETAYRCMAFAAAITPLTTLLEIIPYLGNLLGLAWMTYLLVVASTEIHAIPAKKAWVGFGVIAVIFGLTSLSAEIAGRRLTRGMEQWQQENQATLNQLENLEEMSPEEAGKAVGEFLKGFGQAAEN